MRAHALVLVGVLACSSCAGTGVGDREIVGSWTLTSVTVDGQVSQVSTDLVYSFDGQGRWSGSNGCNDLEGEFEISDSGDFEATADVQTDVGCDAEALPMGRLIESATRAEVASTELKLFDEADRAVCVFARKE